jgi:hypothetical protein
MIYQPSHIQLHITAQKMTSEKPQFTHLHRYAVLSRNQGSPLWDPSSYLQLGGAWGNRRDIDRADYYVSPSLLSINCGEMVQRSKAPKDVVLALANRGEGSVTILHQWRSRLIACTGYLYVPIMTWRKHDDGLGLLMRSGQPLRMMITSDVHKTMQRVYRYVNHHVLQVQSDSNPSAPIYLFVYNTPTDTENADATIQTLNAHLQYSTPTQ